jgi:hypothetical protein
MVNYVIITCLVGAAVLLLISSKTEKKKCNCESCTCNTKQ